MTGPEHYRRAEACLTEAERVVTTATPSTYVEAVQASAHLTDKAQAHATLALAAATAETNVATYSEVSLGFNPEWAEIVQ